MDKKKEEIFNHIYENYKYLMFYIAMGILNDNFWAEDAVQESMIKILNNLDKIDQCNSNRTKRLIITITKNTTIDIYRKKKRELANETELEELVDCTMKYNEETEENALLEVINHLPDKYRDVLLLKFSSGFKNREISGILGISEINVRKRISRAKKLLVKKMKGSDKNDGYLLN